MTGENNDDIVNIIVFIFDAIIKISNSKDLIKNIKIHTSDNLMSGIFLILTDKYIADGTIKSAKKYGKWIDIKLI